MNPLLLYLLVSTTFSMNADAKSEILSKSTKIYMFQEFSSSPSPKISPFSFNFSPLLSRFLPQPPIEKVFVYKKKKKKKIIFFQHKNIQIFVSELGLSPTPSSMIHVSIQHCIFTFFVMLTLYLIPYYLYFAFSLPHPVLSFILSPLFPSLALLLPYIFSPSPRNFIRDLSGVFVAWPAHRF